MAFVDLEEVGRFHAYGRAYLIILSQLRHIALEENGGEGKVSILPSDLDGKSIGEVTKIRSNGWYDQLVSLGVGPDRTNPAVSLTGE